MMIQLLEHMDPEVFLLTSSSLPGCSPHLTWAAQPSLQLFLKHLPRPPPYPPITPAHKTPVLQNQVTNLRHASTWPPAAPAPPTAPQGISDWFLLLHPSQHCHTFPFTSIPFSPTRLVTSCHSVTKALRSPCICTSRSTCKVRSAPVFLLIRTKEAQTYPWRHIHQGHLLPKCSRYSSLCPLNASFLLLHWVISASKHV